MGRAEQNTLISELYAIFKTDLDHVHWLGLTAVLLNLSRFGLIISRHKLYSLLPNLSKFVKGQKYINSIEKVDFRGQSESTAGKGLPCTRQMGLDPQHPIYA